MSPDAEHILLGRTHQTAYLDERANGLGVAQFHSLGLLFIPQSLKSSVTNILQVSRVVQIEPYDVARVGILTAKGPFGGQVLAIFVEADHTNVVMVREQRLYLLPEAILNNIICYAFSIAIDKDGVAGRLRHIDQVVLAAPRIKVLSLRVVHLLHGQLVVTLRHRQFAVAHGISGSGLGVPLRDVHRQQSVRGGIGERIVLTAHGDIAVEVINVGDACAVGLQFRLLPCLAVCPGGISSPRHVGIPLAYKFTVRSLFRNRVVVVVRRTRGEYACAADEGGGQHPLNHPVHFVFD